VSADTLSPGTDKRSAFALVYVAVVLCVLEYGFLPFRVEARLQGLEFGHGPAPSLEAGITWAAVTSLLFLVLPLCFVLFAHREAPASIGWRAQGFSRHVGVYLGLFLLMLPAVLFAANREDFSSTYPFVPAARQDLQTFLIWEACYLAQFWALEAFFRGYLLFTLERSIGKLAVFVMVVPYCMIHFHKPMLEALGAIFAGVALGYLALRYRSWYGGALLHSLVAVTMDSLAVRHTLTP
jgi:membrane protease YdiL (CAAX protease family)